MNHLIVQMKKIVLFVFAFCLVLNITAQKKTDLAGLNTEQLNLYKKKATSLRNEGIVMTVAGAGVAVFGIWMINTQVDEYRLFDSLEKYGKYVLVSTIGLASAGVGIPLWIVGSNRKSAAEVYLIKHDLKSSSSNAIGLGLSIRF